MNFVLSQGPSCTGKSDLWFIHDLRFGSDCSHWVWIKVMNVYWQYCSCLTPANYKIHLLNYYTISYYDYKYSVINLTTIVSVGWLFLKQNELFRNPRPYTVTLTLCDLVSNSHLVGLILTFFHWYLSFCFFISYAYIFVN